MGVFSASAAAEILSIKRRKVLLYIEQEIITPSATRDHRKSGLSFLDLVRLWVVSQLESLGIPPRFLREMLVPLTDEQLMSLASDENVITYIVVRRELNERFALSFITKVDMTLASLLGTIDKHLTPGQATIIVPFGSVFELIAKKVRRHFDR